MDIFMILIESYSEYQCFELCVIDFHEVVFYLNIKIS